MAESKNVYLNYEKSFITSTTNMMINIQKQQTQYSSLTTTLIAWMGKSCIIHFVKKEKSNMFCNKISHICIVQSY
jgi:hypothetical protein